MLFVFLALYLATWIWGIPATHTQIAAEVMKDYKQASRSRLSEVREGHPRPRFGASYAVLPFVIVNRYEYQVASLWGWGGFTMDVWYMTGGVNVLRMTRWIS